jgi:hypothetical protein
MRAGMTTMRQLLALAGTAARATHELRYDWCVAPLAEAEAALAADAATAETLTAEGEGACPPDDRRVRALRLPCGG